MPTGHTIPQAMHRTKISWLALHTRRSPALPQAALRARRAAGKMASPGFIERRSLAAGAVATSAAIKTPSPAASASAVGLIATLARMFAILGEAWRFADDCRRHTGCWDDASFGIRGPSVTLPSDGGATDLQK